MLPRLVIRIFFAANLLAQVPITFQYFYDETGQLTKVVDSTGIVIEYVYDAVGNMLQIKRSAVAPGALTIFNVTPQQAGPLTSITIQGQGFSTTPAANLVKFNGIAATVVSATSTSLVVNVPAGAITGPLTVTVGLNTASSPSPFTVVPLPVITSVTPHGAFPNTTVPSFKVVGINLTGSAFTFLPAFAPPAIGVSSVSIDATGTSATMALSVSANAAGGFTLVATNAVGSSSAFPSAANSFSVVADPNADSDGDGLPNGLEIQLGTDPLNPDTDGDGFSDGVEVNSGSNPLDPNSTPLNSRISGYVISRTLSVSSTGPTPATPSEIDSKTFSVLNIGASLQTPIEADSKPFSVLSIAPAANRPSEADTIPFSVCNELSGPASCASYAGLRLVSTIETGGKPLAPTGRNQDDRASVGEPGPVDGRPFSVLGVAPTDQATNIAPQSTVALVFSAPLDPAALTSANFSVSTGHQPLDPEIRYSADFRTVMLTAPLPADESIRVSVSGQVRDLWGRELPAFESEFRTAAAPGTAPMVLAQRPAVGVTGAGASSAIRLSLSKTMNWSSVRTALQVTRNGVAVEGTIQFAQGGKDVEFIPYLPFDAGAVVKVALSGTRDAGGRLSPGYETLFTIASTANEIAEPTRAVPGGTAVMTLNPVIEIEYSRALDYSTVTSSTIVLREDLTSEAVTASVTLRGDQIVRIVPGAPLLPGTSYSVAISDGLTDIAGRPAIPLRQSFTTGSESVWEPPRLLSAKPAERAADIDTSAEIRLLFDRPINPLTLNGNTLRLVQDDAAVAFSISLAGSGREVILTPVSFLRDSARVMVTGSGVEDLAGNLVPSFAVRFQVRAAPRLAQAASRTNGQLARRRAVPSERRVIQFLIGRR